MGESAYGFYGVRGWMVGEPAAAGLFDGFGLLSLAQPLLKGDRVPVRHGGAEAWKCGLGRRSCLLELPPAIAQLFVNLETQPIKGDQSVRLGVPLPSFGIGPTRRFPHDLERRPLPGVGEQPLEQILATELADHIGAPPAKPRLVFTAFARPGNSELHSEYLVELSLTEVHRAGL